MTIGLRTLAIEMSSIEYGNKFSSYLTLGFRTLIKNKHFSASKSNAVMYMEHVSGVMGSGPETVVQTRFSRNI
jgi:hypothetical protein